MSESAERRLTDCRLLVCLFYTCCVSAHPEKLIVGLLFLFEFMVLDHLLSNQFVRWPVASPNYFYRWIARRGSGCGRGRRRR